MSKESKTRIYTVEPVIVLRVGGTPDVNAGPRLVRAQNKAAALRHAARTSLTVALATQDDIVNALSRQIPIEDVADDAAEQE